MISTVGTSNAILSEVLAQYIFSVSASNFIAVTWIVVDSGDDSVMMGVYC